MVAARSDRSSGHGVEVGQAREIGVATKGGAHDRPWRGGDTGGEAIDRHAPRFPGDHEGDGHITGTTKKPAERNSRKDAGIDDINRSEGVCKTLVMWGAHTTSDGG